MILTRIDRNLIFDTTNQVLAVKARSLACFQSVNPLKMGDEKNLGTPVALSAQNRESFAYPTMKDRVPIILCKVIDLLHRERLPLGIKDTNALKAVIEKMVRNMI